MVQAKSRFHYQHIISLSPLDSIILLLSEFPQPITSLMDYKCIISSSKLIKNQMQQIDLKGRKGLENGAQVVYEMLPTPLLLWFQVIHAYA